MTPVAPTRQLAAFVAGLRYEALPEAVRAQLGALLLDYLRVASIGERMRWSRWAAALAARQGGSGGSRLLFSRDSGDPERVCFVNATYAGSCDADDVHVGAMLHPGCIVFSAALAVGQDRGSSGAEVLAAVTAGYEVMIRVALAIQPSHFRRGFQSTATCGGFGAAAAAAHLLFPGPDRAQRIAETFGLVASFCGGLTQFYHSGSTVKRIHAAQAASQGVRAALLAEAGFSGPTDVLEGRDGFARAYADAANWEALGGELGCRWHALEVAVKAHACSARVQAAIEAAAELGTAQGVKAADVAAIRLGIPQVIQGRLTATEPRDLQAAQMSSPFAVSLVLSLGDRLGPGFALNVEDFESGMADPGVAALARRVECVVDDEVERVSNAESVGARVTVRLASGGERTAFVATPQGSAARPFTTQDHVARFRHEMARRFAPARCDALLDAASGFARMPHVGALADALAP